MTFNEIIKVDTADEAFAQWWNCLTNQGDKIESRDGLVVGECINAITVINDPTRCIMRNKIRKMPIRYAIGEMLWYMSGNSELKPIQLYTDNWNRMSDDGVHVNSNYGYCIKYKFGFDQWKYVFNILRKHRETRQAVIHIKAPNNTPSKDVNCTVALQFILRDDKLYLTAYMRSNDLWLGFPFDVFQFANMQVLMAMELGCGLGTYTHIAGSLHLYERDFKTGWKNASAEANDKVPDWAIARDTDKVAKEIHKHNELKEEAGNEWLNEKDRLIKEALSKAEAQIGMSELMKQYEETDRELERLRKEYGVNASNMGTGKSMKGV